MRAMVLSVLIRPLLFLSGSSPRPWHALRTLDWMLIAVLLPLFATRAGGQEAAIASQAVALTNITVIDVARGAARSGMTVLIRDGRIARIQTAEELIAEDAEEFEGLGKFVIPGLWDMHVHLSSAKESALPVLVANGVTGVRDLGSDLAEIDGWRAQIRGGRRIGPRIIRCGPMLNGQSFNPYQLVAENPEQARGVVRALKFVGVDFIKIHRRLPRDAYFAVIEEADAHGLSVVGHIPITVRPEEASDAGQLVEHVTTLFEGTFSSGVDPPALFQAIRKFRQEGAGDLFARFARNGTPVTPTLGAWSFLIEYESQLADPRIQFMAKSLREELKRSPPMTAEQVPHWTRLYEEYRQVVALLSGSGVRLMAGTDLSNWLIPGFSLHRELASLVDAGLTPLQALQSATLNPAIVHDLEGDFGSVEVGKVADLVILDANPLEDISNTERIAGVVLGGRLLNRKELDLLLSEGKELASLH